LLKSRSLLPPDERAGGGERGWRPHLQARVRPMLVVVDAPSFDDTSGLGKAGEPARVEAFLAEAIEPFCIGLPGSMSCGEP
jgi:hypothetical protein